MNRSLISHSKNPSSNSTYDQTTNNVLSSKVKKHTSSESQSSNHSMISNTNTPLAKQASSSSNVINSLTMAINKQSSSEMNCLNFNKQISNDSASISFSKKLESSEYLEKVKKDTNRTMGKTTNNCN